jgi:hypothetical protein
MPDEIVLKKKAHRKDGLFFERDIRRSQKNPIFNSNTHTHINLANLMPDEFIGSKD